MRKSRFLAPKQKKKERGCTEKSRFFFFAEKREFSLGKTSFYREKRFRMLKTRLRTFGGRENCIQRLLALKDAN